MYNRPIGNMSKPADHVVVEDFTTQDRRESFLTIAMENLPATASISRDISDYFKTTPFGELYVEDGPVTGDGLRLVGVGSRITCNFSLPFDAYLEQVRQLPPGVAREYRHVSRLDNGKFLVLMNPTLALAINKDVLLADEKKPRACCVLATKVVCEYGPTQGINHLDTDSEEMRRVRLQGVIGYYLSALTDQSNLIDATRDKVIEFARRYKPSSAFVTHGEIATMSEALCGVEEMVKRTYCTKPTVVDKDAENLQKFLVILDPQLRELFFRLLSPKKI